MTLLTTTVRDATAEDLDGIVGIDAEITGRQKPVYWRGILDAYGSERDGRVALVAIGPEGRVIGHLFGEVRAWEFGSAPCGWVFAIGVHPEIAREGTASALCRHAMARFHSMGVEVVRTMVRRNDVPMLSFFRSMGFVGGPFSEMEKVIRSDDLPGGVL